MLGHSQICLIDPLQVQYFQGARVLILQSINVKKKTYIWNILPILAMPWSVAMDFGTPKSVRRAEACMEHVCLVQRRREKKLASLAVSVDAQPLEVRQCYFIPINILLVVWNIFYFSIYWECDHPNWLSYFSERLKPPTIYIYTYYHIIISLGK